MSTLVLNKTLPVFLCGVINVYLVILLIKYSINADVGIHCWNWVAINAPISHRPGLADHHLVSCPLPTNVRPDIDRFGDAVHQMRRPLNCGLKLVGIGSCCTTPDPMDAISTLTFS
jgi:hypothetical protein